MVINMRKLAAAALGFSSGILISHYILNYDWLIIASIIMFIVSLLGLFFSGTLKIRIFIFCISMISGFLWSNVYTEIYVKPYHELHEENITVDAIVIDYPAAREPRGYRVDVSLQEPAESKLSVNARVYYYNEVIIKPGDVIRFTVKLRRADITDEGERYDALSSRGIFLTGYISGDIEIVDSEGSLAYFPKKAAHNIALKAEAIYPDDVSHFIKALLVGRRDDLYKDTALHASLSASGIIHIVAISGMHISFLMGVLSLMFKNKRLLAVYGIPVLLVFMAMTGFTPAVTRAGIMQIFLICAPIFRRETDNITSLSAAILVLLAANPYSCASAGLQLSFAATLGIILFTSRINQAVTDFVRGKKISGKKLNTAIINYTSSCLSTTIGALVFTLPLTVIHFGYVSLIAPVTNLLTIGVVSLTFPFGLLSVILGFIHPIIGATAAYPVGWGVRYIIKVAGLMASVPYSVIYFSNAHIIIWLIYVYIMFITLPFLKTRFRQYLYPVCVSVILLFAVILLSLLLPGTQDNSVTVINVGQGLSVVADIEGTTMIVDCGSISTSKAGEITHEYLLSIGCTAVDFLLITHFHDDHVNGVEFLLSRVYVSTLIIPDPDGSYLAEDIIELARRRGTDIIYLTETLRITINKSNIMIYPPLGSGDENERGLSALIMGDINVLITGDMNASVERSLLRFADLPKLDMLVTGHHGSRESTCEELLQALSPEIAVIPVGKNSFGHPHPETLERLSQYGATIYRTDEMGHVSVYFNGR